MEFTKKRIDEAIEKRDQKAETAKENVFQAREP